MEGRSGVVDICGHLCESGHDLGHGPRAAEQRDREEINKERGQGGDRSLLSTHYARGCRGCRLQRPQLI